MIRKVIHRIAHSLSARLLGVFLMTALVYGFAARYAVELVLDRDYLREVVGSHISLHTTYFLRDLGSPPDIERAKAITDTNPLDIRIQGPDIDWMSDPDFPDPGSMQFETSRLFDRVHENLSGFDDRDGEGQGSRLEDIAFSRYRDHSFVKIEIDGYRITLASPPIAVTPGPDLATPIIGLISILVLAGCFFAVTWLVRPIQWIKEGAERIGQGDLDYRIPKARRDDLGELTVDINRMADDVQGMLEAKQQMLLAISHELRSPLTRTKVALEFLQDDQQKQNILDDIDEMERLITDLLESERLNTGHSALQCSTVDLKELVRGVADAEFAAERERLEIKVPDEPVLYEADETRLRLLVKNLVENALCYTPAGGDPVVLSIEHGPEGISIRVADHGQGMTPEQVERATEPFYRADPARCRDTGGFGLGLYLCRRIAKAHGGSLEISSTEGQGTTVILRLPLSGMRSGQA
jgi:signal transduction histidine kinase